MCTSVLVSDNTKEVSFIWVFNENPFILFFLLFLQNIIYINSNNSKRIHYRMNIETDTL